MISLPSALPLEQLFPPDPWLKVAERRRGVPLGMHRRNPEYLDPDSSDHSVTADILLRQEPDEDENEEEDEDEGGDEEEDDEESDDGYSE